MSKAPTVLLVATSRWLTAARLAIAFWESGSRPEVVCPHAHPVTLARAGFPTHTFHALRPLRCFASAIAKANPDLVIPCDDLAVSLLCSVYERAQTTGKEKLRQILERSIGGLATQTACGSRVQLAEIAAREGICVADTAAVSSVEELFGWLDINGFPAVIKADGTCGGAGVEIVTGREEARKAFERLNSPPLVLRAAKRAFIDHDFTLLAPSLLRRQPALSVQKFIQGQEATCTVACWQGRIVARLTFEILGISETQRARNGSPRNRQIMRSHELLRCWHIGCNFRESTVSISSSKASSGQSRLIEINARATQTAHLALGPGLDVAASLRWCFIGNFRELSEEGYRQKCDCFISGGMDEPSGQRLH